MYDIGENIDETGQTLRKKLSCTVNGHRNDIEKYRNKPVAEYFNSLDHCMENMKVTVVKKLTSSTNRKQREILEQKFIHKFDCINQRLNRDYLCLYVIL